MHGKHPGGVDAVDKIPVARIASRRWKAVGFTNTVGWIAASPDIRFYLVGGRRRLYHHQDANRLIRAWQKAGTTR